MVGLTSLVKEMLFHVFDFLDYNSLASLKEVCKEFSKCIDENFWRRKIGVGCGKEYLAHPYDITKTTFQKRYLHILSIGKICAMHLMGSGTKSISGIFSKAYQDTDYDGLRLIFSMPRIERECLNLLEDPYTCGMMLWYHCDVSRNTVTNIESLDFIHTMGVLNENIMNKIIKITIQDGDSDMFQWLLKKERDIVIHMMKTYRHPYTVQLFDDLFETHPELFTLDDPFRINGRYAFNEFVSSCSSLDLWKYVYSIGLRPNSKTFVYAMGTFATAEQLDYLHSIGSKGTENGPEYDPNPVSPIDLRSYNNWLVKNGYQI